MFLTLERIEGTHCPVFLGPGTHSAKLLYRGPSLFVQFFRLGSFPCTSWGEGEEELSVLTYATGLVTAHPAL